MYNDILYFDLETLPTADEQIIKSIKDSIKPPATYKKQETIDKWLAENLESEAKEQIAKTSFDGAYGSIACVAFADDNNEIQSLSTHDISEFELLTKFNKFIKDTYKAGMKPCGHNIHGFDLKFLKKRMIINSVSPCQPLIEAFKMSKYDSRMLDTMLLWDLDNKASQDKLSTILGLGGKGDFNGSMVAETWKTTPKKVVDYCKDDVKQVREIYKRIAFK